MALSTVGVKVYVDNKLVRGVTDVPALGASPEKIDVTTLADKSRKYINGVKDYGDLEFACIYDPDITEGVDAEGSINYKELREMERAGLDKEVKVVLPGIEEDTDGEHFLFSGKVAVAMNEAAVNAALTFTLSIALSTEIEFSLDADKGVQ